jgi:hypothetical protein
VKEQNQWHSDLDWVLSPSFLKYLENEFAETRARVQRAVEASPKSGTFEDALKQVKAFSEASALSAKKMRRS